MCVCLCVCVRACVLYDKGSHYIQPVLWTKLSTMRRESRHAREEIQYGHLVATGETISHGLLRYKKNSNTGGLHNKGRDKNEELIRAEHPAGDKGIHD